MNKEQFDDLIKNKLESISSPLGDDTWSRFEKILDADADLHQEIDDSTFDTTIKEKISTDKFAGSDTQWQILKDKLNNIKLRRDSIYLSKAMEVAAVFLIIFTLTNLNIYILPTQNKTEQNNPTQFASDIKNTSQKVLSKENNTTISKESQFINVRNRVSAQKSTKYQNISKEVISTFLSRKVFISATQSMEQVNESGLALSDLGSQSKEAIDQGTDLNTAIVNTMALRMPTSLASYESNKIPYIPLPVAPIYTEMASIFPMHIVSPKGKSIKAISTIVSADINLINTPFDKLYSIPSYNKEALNNSFGVRISTQNNNLEIESGLDYSKREYRPALFKEAFGNTSDVYFETSLDKITFDIANIPLNLKYHFFNKRGWSSYIMVGAALNLIVNAAYETPTVLVEGRPSPDRYTPERPRLEEREFTEGLLHGSAFKDNYFATAGFGIGLEKEIFKNTSIYVQPSYQRHLLTPGIGPKNDKIHTSSLQFGVKTILN